MCTACPFTCTSKQLALHQHMLVCTVSRPSGWALQHYPACWLCSAAPEVVLNAPVVLQSISSSNTSQLSYTFTAEPGHSKQLLALQSALRKAQAGTKATISSNSNNVTVQDASLKVLHRSLLGATINCKEISPQCAPPYLGRAFRALGKLELAEAWACTPQLMVTCCWDINLHVFVQKCAERFLHLLFTPYHIASILLMNLCGAHSDCNRTTPHPWWACSAERLPLSQ